MSVASPLLTPDWQHRPAPETVPSGIPGLNLPRGALAEICGPRSSGRTGLMLSILAAATARQETCALIDTDDAFDPHSAAAAGIDLGRLLWVRCGGNAGHALKAADLLVQGGGFGLVVLDLGDTPAPTARRISLTSWFRLRRAVEYTPTVLVAVERDPLAKTCASLVLEMRRERARWTGAPGVSRLLRGLAVSAGHRKPPRAERRGFDLCTPAS